jgi:hypothetical protein
MLGEGRRPFLGDLQIIDFWIWIPSLGSVLSSDDISMSDISGLQRRDGKIQVFVDIADLMQI